MQGDDVEQSVNNIMISEGLGVDRLDPFIMIVDSQLSPESILTLTFLTKIHNQKNSYILHFVFYLIEQSKSNPHQHTATLKDSGL